MADFHELLNKLRIEKGVTQEEVATAIGVAKSTFAKYDRGEREPNFETLKKIRIRGNVPDGCIHYRYQFSIHSLNARQL